MIGLVATWNPNELRRLLLAIGKGLAVSMVACAIVPDRLWAAPQVRGNYIDSRRAAEEMSDLVEQQNFPWYDSARSSVRPPALNPGPRSSAADRAKVPAAKTRPTPAPRATPAPAAPTLPSLSRFNLSGFLWVTLILILTGLVGFFLWITYVRGNPSSDSSTRGDSARSGSRRPVEQLPIELDVSALDLRTQSRLAFEQGEVRKALACLFGQALLALDDSRKIKLRRGKTNRQYLSELDAQSDLGQTFEQLMLAFENAFFGGRPISRSEYESHWARLEWIERSLSRGGVGGSN